MDSARSALQFHKSRTFGKIRSFLWLGLTGGAPKIDKNSQKFNKSSNLTQLTTNWHKNGRNRAFCRCRHPFRGFWAPKTSFSTFPRPQSHTNRLLATKWPKGDVSRPERRTRSLICGEKSDMLRIVFIHAAEKRTPLNGRRGAMARNENGSAC